MEVIYSQYMTDPIGFSTQDIIQKCPLRRILFRSVLFSPRDQELAPVLYTVRKLYLKHTAHQDTIVGLLNYNRIIKINFESSNKISSQTNFFNSLFYFKSRDTHSPAGANRLSRNAHGILPLFNTMTYFVLNNTQCLRQIINTISRI